MVQAFLCPSQRHNSSLTTGAKPISITGVPRTGPDGEGPYKGAISDYRAVAGSTCMYTKAGITFSWSDSGQDIPGYNNTNSHLADGPIPSADPASWVRVGPSKPRCAEVAGGDFAGEHHRRYQQGPCWAGRSDAASRKMARPTMAITFPACGWVSCSRSAPSVMRRPFGTLRAIAIAVSISRIILVSAASHPGVVQFVMCDGSVQALSTNIDGPVLDAMATRDGGEVYDVNGTIPSCQHN